MRARSRRPRVAGMADRVGPASEPLIGRVDPLVAGRRDRARAEPGGPLHPHREGQPAQATIVLLVTLPLALRRRWPLPVLIVVASAWSSTEARPARWTSPQSWLAGFTAGEMARDRIASRRSSCWRSPLPPRSSAGRDRGGRVPGPSRSPYHHPGAVLAGRGPGPARRGSKPRARTGGRACATRA